MATKAGPNIITDGLVLNIDPANVKSYPAKNDPYRDQVSLLLDGASFTDKSRNNYTITANGNVSISNAVQLFGNDTMYFDGNGDYLSTAGSALPSGTGDFTIEGWFNSIRGWQFDSNQTYNFIEGAVGSSVMSFFHAYYNGTGQVKLANNSNGIGVTFDPSVYNMQPNTWYHIAVTRSSGTVRLFLNGALVSSGSLTTNFGTTATTYIGGAARSASLSFYGYIGYLAVTNNVARYTSNFTPPLSFSAPTRITDTKGKSVGTLTNGPVFSNVQNGAISFDGAGDYLDFPSSESFNFSSNNFCIESWIYLNQYPVNNNGYYSSMIICKDQISNRSWDFLVTGTSSANTTLQFTGFINNSSIQQANISYAFNLNTWYHVACSRVGNYIYLYVNGICINPGGTSFTATIQNTSSVVRIGAQVYSTYYYYFNGNIANLKVYKDRGLSASEVEKNYTATRKRFVETPKTIPGLQLWLDGADLGTMRQNSNGTTAVAVNGDPVGYWGDKSGNGRHATQATAGSRPSLLASAINSLPSINFSTTTYHRLNYTNFSSSDKTIFIVHQGLSSSLDTRLLTVNTDYKLNIGASTYSGNNLSFVREAIVWTNSAFSRIYNPTIFKVTYTNSPSFSANISRYTASGLSNVQTYTSTGSGSDGDYLSQAGYYAEVISYNRILTDEEHNKVRNYLNQKWGIY